MIPESVLQLGTVRRPIHEIIVHCSATPAGKDFTVADIRAWHKQRGWSDIGYHFVVYRDGSVHIGRPLNRIGAHVAGHNSGTIGVCYIGGVEANDVKKARDTRTVAQRNALEELLTMLVSAYPTIKRITGHNQYANKACPSFNAEPEYMHIVRPNKSRKNLLASKTFLGGGTAATASAAEVGQSAYGLVNAANEANTYYTSGDIFGIVIGSLIFGAAVYVMYSRWDDAGRPSFKKILYSMTGESAEEYSMDGGDDRYSDT